VNKSELVDAVATATGLEKRQADAAVSAVVGEIVAQTKAGQPVSIFGFGTFKPTARAARTGRNPRTGEPVKIAASKNVKFQPSTAFKTALNTKKSAAKKAAPAKKTGTTAAQATAKKTSAKATPARAATKTAARATVKKTPAKTTAKKR
jgi:DNA-binding protein HU-beta